jgi:hypothetical protein
MKRESIHGLFVLGLKLREVDKFGIGTINFEELQT